jgi:7-carboxy-7-deazaguanine synthase
MQTDWEKFDECLEKFLSPSPLIPLPSGRGKASASETGRESKISIKIVIKDDIDYKYAQDAAAKYPHLPLYLQPCNQPGVDMMERMRWLVDKIKTDQWYDARILPQLHVMMWGNERGV